MWRSDYFLGYTLLSNIKDRILSKFCRAIFITLCYTLQLSILHHLTDLAHFFVFLGEINRNNHPEVFLGKSVLKICSKFAREHPWRSVVSIKLLCSFIEITFWHECSPLSLLYIFRTPFSKNNFGWLFLN